jgi:hypothetical protein
MLVTGIGDPPCTTIVVAFQRARQPTAETGKLVAGGAFGGGASRGASPDRRSF